MMKNIVLIGFMGSGKTTIGKALEEKTDMAFVDTDELIEAYEGCKISDIFESKGEEYFRRLENETLKKLLVSTDFKIISTGGGIVAVRNNIVLLKQLGKVVYLRIKPETAVKRLEGDKTRPLLMGEDKLVKVERLMADRKELYEVAADNVIDTDCLLVNETVNIILKDVLSSINDYVPK